MTDENKVFVTQKITNRDIYESIQKLHCKQDDLCRRLESQISSCNYKHNKARLYFNALWTVVGTQLTVMLGFSYWIIDKVYGLVGGR